MQTITATEYLIALLASVIVMLPLYLILWFKTKDK